MWFHQRLGIDETKWSPDSIAPSSNHAFSQEDLRLYIFDGEVESLGKKSLKTLANLEKYMDNKKDRVNYQQHILGKVKCWVNVLSEVLGEHTVCSTTEIPVQSSFFDLL